MLREKVQLRGDHNIANVLAAFAIGHAAGFKLDDMLEAVEEFRGVPHRLELVRELHGVRWYNDSIATAPERAAAISMRLVNRSCSCSADAIRIFPGVSLPN
jgi:UDP-N-acetylmuramoylalanine--D-glutamate ligase